MQVFDDILLCLAERAEARALAISSATLAGLDCVPEATASRLARHDAAEVAGPMLLKCRSLSDRDLLEVASHRGQTHLQAISGRPSLSKTLTDVLLKRAGKEVSRALASNAGARFSAKGYAAMMATAERDDTVAESLALRPDLPDAVLDELIAKTTAVVRARLSKVAPQALRPKIQAALEASRRGIALRQWRRRIISRRLPWPMRSTASAS